MLFPGFAADNAAGGLITLALLMMSMGAGLLQMIDRYRQSAVI